MCDRLIKGVITGFLLWTGAGLGGGWAVAEEAFMRPPQAKYTAQQYRDPFVQPRAGRLQNVMEKVDIETLRLTGVIRNPKQTMALFASETGPKFGYLLKGEKLYRENHQALPDIRGKVISPQKVMLQQGEKQIVFKLRAN